METELDRVSPRVTVIAVVLSILMVLGGFGLIIHSNDKAIAVEVALHTMPKHIDVNGIIWRTEQVDQLDIYGGDGGNKYAYTRCNIHVISFKIGSPNLRKLLLHELSHAAVCTDTIAGPIPNNFYYNSTTPEAHEGIYNFSDVWAELFYRNPDLANYLGSKD